MSHPFGPDPLAIEQRREALRLEAMMALIERREAGLPKRGAHILARNLTQPIGKPAAQKAVEEVREAIGVMAGPDRLVPHGWRHNAAKELAEAGCSDADIQAVTGHKTRAMVQKYRGQADQKAASKRAQSRRERNANRT